MEPNSLYDLQMKAKACIFLLLLLGSFLSSAEIIIVEVYYSKYCEHCEKVLNEFLPSYIKKYEGTVKFVLFEIEDNLDNYEKLLNREAQAGKSGKELPVIFIGNDVFGGETEIYRGLPSALERAAKGVQMAKHLKPTRPEPEKRETIICVAAETVSVPKESTVTAEMETVYAMFFYEKGCAHCDRISHDLRLLARNSPKNFGVVFAYESYDINDKRSKLMHEALCERYGVEDISRMTTPAVFFEGAALIYGHNELSYFSMVEVVKRFPNGTVKLWETIKPEELSAAENRITTRFSRLNVLPIIFAGLMDGINPCAFGALIFFITFLTVVQRKKREILLVGVVYTFSVFITYYSIGAGFLGFVSSIPIFRTVARWVYIITAILAVALGIVSMVDFFKARTGKFAEMTLQLPEKLKKRIHKVIITENEPRTRRNFIFAAFITGFSVSLLELACTGQVYLPTIIYVLGIPGLRVKAHLFLLLYNFMFTVPLIFVFVISYFGTTSEQLNMFLKKKTAIIKFLTALMFFAMAALLWRSLVAG